MPEEIVITHTFNAPPEKVWQAWTDPKLIAQWWGPTGFSAPSIKVDFKVGGKYTYAMQGPPGSEWDKVMYSSGVYQEIILYKMIVATDYFSDEDGNKLPPTEFGQDEQFPDEMSVTILFEEITPGRTQIRIVYPAPTNPAHFEAMLKSGMKEGWLSSLEKLASVIE